jgi:hypothetical protein
MCFSYLNCPFNNCYRQNFDTNVLPTAPGVTGVPQLMVPIGPPPPFIPSETQATFQHTGAGTGFFLTVDPSTFSTCMFMYVYIWLKDGSGFWSWITYVDNNSIGGWRWSGTSWIQFRLNINAVHGFGCF